VLKNYEKYNKIIQENCQKWVETFSDEEFKFNFVKMCIEKKILN